MIAIILKEIKTIEYFLGIDVHWYHNRQTVEILFDSYNVMVGKVCERERNSEWRIITTTDKFNREYETSEYINVNGEDLKIVQVSHDTEGNILYYTNKVEYVYDDESKTKADQELLKRREILLERREVDGLQKIKEEMDKIEGVWGKLNNKKWYQFWK